MMALQGAIGGVQYALELPAEIVWVHVVLAATTWLAILWAVAALGRPLPRGVPSRGAGEPARRGSAGRASAGGSRRLRPRRGR